MNMNSRTTQLKLLKSATLRTLEKFNHVVELERLDVIHKIEELIDTEVKE